MDSNTLRNLKNQLYIKESSSTNKEVYSFLYQLWQYNKTPVIAALIVDEMVCYFIESESGLSDVSIDEYKLYQELFQEVMEYGLSNYLNDKMYLWLMTFYCSAISTYYYMFKTSLLKDGEVSAKQLLSSKVADLYPTSMMLKIIKRIQGGDNIWLQQLSTEECKVLYAELKELDLCNNRFDKQLKEMFLMKKLEEKMGI